MAEYKLGMQKSPGSIPDIASERFSGGEAWDRGLPENLDHLQQGAWLAAAACKGTGAMFLHLLADVGQPSCSSRLSVGMDVQCRFSWLSWEAVKAA